MRAEMLLSCNDPHSHFSKPSISKSAFKIKITDFEGQTQGCSAFKFTSTLKGTQLIEQLC